MPSAPELPYDPLYHLRTDAVRFLEIVTDHGLELPVRSCPDWNLGDLAWHVGNVWNRFGEVVAAGLTTAEQYRSIERPPRPADDLLIDWVTAAHTALYSALVSADPDDTVATWAGTQDVHWVLRRMTQETALHRWDAADAVDNPYEIPAAVAADGIDEFLMWFAGRRLRDGAAPVGGSVHLHCTDTREHLAEGSDDRSAAVGEWLVSTLDEHGASFTREHAKGDAAVRGTSHDLLLWVWRRAGDPVEILGDAGVAERFQAFSEL